MEFSKRLKYLRESKGLSKAGLAKALGVSRSLITMYENGVRKPSYPILYKLSKFFNLDVEDLISVDEYE